MIALGRERYNRAAARLGLLHIADHLLEDMILRRERDHGHLFVDERNGSMLHLSGGIPFGMDVGDLLQFEGAFERNGIVDAAAEVEEIGTCVKARRDLFDRRGGFERLLEQVGQLEQGVHMRFGRLE